MAYRTKRLENQPKRAIFANVRELVRNNLRWFILGTIAGVALRVIFLIRFPAVVNDSFFYGDIAKNWLQHGVYGLSGTEEISPTYTRLPGYPAFLALIFAIAGMEHYRTVLIVQIVIDLGTCLVCADIARRMFGEKIAKIAFLLAAPCPFLANYAAAALTETLEVFFTAAALDAAIAALQKKEPRLWAVCGIFCGAAILLRPDGALLVITIVLSLGWMALFGKRSAPASLRKPATAAVLVAIISILPLVPWAWRNWRVFRRFQPLAPRYANEENEYVPMGFNRWVKTWMVDYVSVEEIYWPVPGSTVDFHQLAARAFDSARQRAETKRLLDEYNQLLHISPELDSRFEALARERIRSHPLRYYVELPILRILDMWLRPRTEMLPSDPRWWEFNDEPRWSGLAVALGLINLAYVVCAVVGWLRWRHVPWLGLLTLFVVLRSAFLGSLENPEPRYTLEMYPIVIVLAAATLVRSSTRAV